jgi:competence ComEA-like helix-hairpin-helix protein
MNRWLGCSMLVLALVMVGTPALCGSKKKINPQRSPTPTNINTANVLELTQLPGIGVKRAQAISDWRDEHGPFKTKQGLMDIPGFGKKTFENLEPLISVRDRKASPF